MDTGWEHEVTERYLREDLPKVIGEIDTLAYARKLAGVEITQGPKHQNT